jgi:hypothetical protein
MTIVFDVKFTFTKGIPQLNGLVAGTRHDLSIVCAEADRQDIGGMADETTSSGASVEIP